ncbi:MAG: alternative ribosome rescue aminoacyl-tRNA hydrolase ArfB [Planctomycetota bacterium]
MGAGGPLRVNAGLTLPPDDLQIEFARSGGPGGQNVNKVETKVVLRFSLPRSRGLEEHHRERLRSVLAGRITRSGEILVRADRFRDRARNLADARERLAALLANALLVPKVRRPSRPSRGAEVRRLESKRRRSVQKRERGGGYE